MKKLFGVALAAALISAGAFAAGDPVAERKEIFKSFGAATKPTVAVSKGEAPFDLAKVQAALKTYADGAAKIGALFPEGSDKGDTEAAPAIWKDKARFEAATKKFAADAAAAAAAVTDEASLKANLPKVLGNCKSCHDDFRLKKS